MRLLLATDHYPPFIGGAHRQVKLLAIHMTERGHQVAVAAPWYRGGSDAAPADGVELHRIRQLRTAVTPLVRTSVQQHQPPFPDPISVWQLKRLIDRFEPDLIHSYGWISFSVAAAIGRRKIPLVVSARDYGYFCATRTLLRKGSPCSGPALGKCMACAGQHFGVPKGWVAPIGLALSEPLLKRKMTTLHSVSTYVSEVTRANLDLGANDRIPSTVIPSFQDEGLDREEAPPDLSPWLDQLPSDPFVLFVGAFRRLKGLETLFDAYERLDDRPPLVLMGTFERDSPKAFPRGVTVLANVPHAAIMAAWDRALFGVMPSLWSEPLGATVAEAMSRGKAVIGTRPGGHSDMIDEHNGILVPRGDAAALATAMAELIGDPARREALGEAARERARSFSVENVLPRFERVYVDARARSKGTDPVPRSAS